MSGSQDKSFRVWDLEANLKEERSRGHSQDVIRIAVTLDGSFCVSASMDGNFKIWDCENGKELFTLKGLLKNITCYCQKYNIHVKFTSCKFILLFTNDVDKNQTNNKLHKG